MKKTEEALTMGSLFDGIGGFPLAAVRNGIIPVWASEIEAFPIEVTKLRFPEMVHVGDITQLDGAKLPPVHIICGGSPCQDLSVAGARAGLAGERSGLFMEQIRITKEMRDAEIKRGRTAYLIRPRYFVWENVPGAFSSSGGEDFRVVLEEICRIKDKNATIPRPAGGVNGKQAAVSWETGIQSLGEFSTRSFGESPNAVVESHLSQILEDNPHPKYFLSEKACRGVLRRAEARGKALPRLLKETLERQSGLIT